MGNSDTCESFDHGHCWQTHETGSWMVIGVPVRKRHGASTTLEVKRVPTQHWQAEDCKGLKGPLLTEYVAVSELGQPLPHSLTVNWKPSNRGHWPVPANVMTFNAKRQVGNTGGSSPSFPGCAIINCIESTQRTFRLFKHNWIVAVSIG